MRHSGSVARLSFLISAVFLFLVSVQWLDAQVASTGAIVGEITDQSGAVVPQVSVTLVDVATGEERAASTDSAGLYSFPFLPSGTYRLTAKKEGFKTAITENIRVEVNATARRDVAMQVGQVVQEVSVTANAVAVNTTDATLGQVISSKPIVELPLNGRAFMQLGTLVAGAYPAYASNTESLTGNRPGLTVEIGGSHEGSVDFLFDGMPSKHDFYGAVGISPPPDAIAEFKIQTGYFSPQYGLPAVLNVVVKSGTNDFHGGVWEFVRNDVFDARNFFSIGRPPYKQNQFGGDFGGRIIKNKLFFFMDYEGLRYVSTNTTSTGTVPTAAMLQGNFSGLPTIYDPTTYNATTGLKQPFANNIIPPGSISTFAQKFNSWIPAPNTAPLAQFANANLLGATRSTQSDNKFDVKVDFMKGVKDRIFSRFSFLDSAEAATSLFPGAANNTPLTSRNAVLGWTHVFTPTLVNEARFGVDRVFLDTYAPTNASGPDWPTQLGLQNLNQIPQCNAVPAVAMASYSTFGFNFQNCIITSNTDKIFLDNLAWMRGRHRLTMGGQMIRINFRDIASFTQNGAFSFTGVYSGSSVADYVLGDPFSVSGEKPLTPSEWRGWWPDLYINDDFQATRRLTLNFGVRWQFTEPLSEQQNHQAKFDYATGQILTGTQPLSSHYADFAPRVGFAYSPRDNWVVRSSYGVFWDRIPGNELVWQNVGPPYTVGYSAVGGPTVPSISIPGLFPTFTTNLVGSSFFSLNDRSDPYIQQWTLSVQHTMPFHVLAELAYVGKKGTHISTRVDENTAATPGGSRRYPQYGYIAADTGAGTSRYNALELTVKKDVSHGLNFLSAYTYASSLATAGNNWGGFNFTYTHLDWGPESDYMRHRWVTSLGYAVPFGNNLTGAARQVAAGWNVQAILTAQSGYLFSTGLQTQPANIQSTFSNGYPNRVCNGNNGPHTLLQWFNTSCFTVPALNTFGDAGINYLYGPGTKNVDFALLKNFPLWAETRSLQFRAEFFNGFNLVNFSNPGGTVGSPSFGKITGAGAARIIQFALKFTF